MRARPLVAVAALVLAVLALLVAPAAAGATTRPASGAGVGAVVVVPGQQPDAPADDGTGGSAEDEPEVPLPDEGIIPMPDSGREPTEAGERGGALQVLVFVLIVAGVGGIVAMIVRESRRNRAAPTP